MIIERYLLCFQAGNLFGGGSVTSTQQTAPSSTFSFNLLGGSTAPQQQGKSIFGGSTGFSQTPSAFGQPASVFGQSSTPGSIFGQAAPATSTLFGGQTTITPTTSPFAGQSVFGQAQNTNVFGQTQNSTQNTSSIFGQPTLPEQPSSSTNVFGQAQNNLSGNVFGQVQNLAEQPTSTNVFGQTQNTFGNQSTFATPAASAPLFGQNPAFSTQNTTSVFGQPQNTTSVFAQPQTSVFSTPAFSQPQNSSAAFAQPPAAAPNIFSQAAASFGQSTFTPASPQTVNPFSQTSFASPSEQAKVNPFTQAAIATVVVSCNYYSNLEDLTEEEKKAFEATEFELGKIPIKPPPKELCF